MNETNSTASHLPDSRRSWMKRWLLLAIILIMVVNFPVARKRYFTCAICRAGRRTVDLLYFPVNDTLSETECSRWYRENVEPQHAHNWIRGTYTEHYSSIGLLVSATNLSGNADGPLIRFGSGEQLLMYQRCTDPTVARDIFLQLSRWEAPGTTERRMQLETEHVLAKWADGGFSGPWPLENIQPVQ